MAHIPGEAPVHTHGTMGFFVTYYLVCGNTHTDQKRDMFPATRYTQEQCRKEFTERYFAAGVKGITVTPLYELRRYH